MDNEIMLEKLQYLQQLLQENQRLRNYADGGCARETLGQLADIREEIGAMPKAPSAAACQVYLPLPANYTKAAKTEKEQRKKVLLVAAGVTGLLLVLYFATHVQVLNTFSVIGIFATAVIGWFYKMSNDTWKTKEKEFQTAEKKYRDSWAKFKRALSCYGAEVEEGKKEYIQYQLRHYEKYPVFMDTVLGYEEKMEQAQKALDENEAQLLENDVVTPEYYHLVPTIITMLKSGRADSYKEALNMAIEEERQNEIEASRREEEARRIAAMERQAEEERRHNMMMEQQQAEHNRAMERAEQERVQVEKDRFKADERARRDAQRAESDAKQRASQQCMVCAKRSGCRNPGIPGCGAFVPKHY